MEIALLIPLEAEFEHNISLTQKSHFWRVVQEIPRYKKITWFGIWGETTHWDIWPREDVIHVTYALNNA